MDKILNLKKALEDLGFIVTLLTDLEFVGWDMKTRKCIELTADTGKRQEDGTIGDGVEIVLTFHPETFEEVHDILDCPLVDK